LKAVVRCGPWCHGEVRNGGLPDWVQKSGWRLRSTDTNFLAATKIVYEEIARQIHGQLWKDGGPVIGIQVDNEFRGSPEYLLALKKMAIEAGLDVPFYIKTGWPAMRVPVPLGELIPLFGAYAEGFWVQNIEPMSGKDWENFTFKLTRTDTGVGNDTLKVEQAGDTAGTEKYPYLTCEIGGGMPASYHRRMNYDERDVEAVVLTQLGSGSTLIGYYMYHGGQNPEGKLSTLQESRATDYPNDLPVKSYDFNAPLGEFGQINPHYYWLRRLHLFLDDFGASLAQMPPTLPELRPTNRNDLATLRWSVRSDGRSGYVFVNNYQRLQPLPAKKDVQFKLALPGGEQVFPQKPVTIPADSFFYWPFNLDAGGATLIYATAQPICRVGNTFYFAETPGVPSEFAFDSQTLAGSSSRRSVFNVKPSRKPAIKLQTKSGGAMHIVLLNEMDSLALRKTEDGKDVYFETPQKRSAMNVNTKLVQRAGPAREIPLSTGRTQLAIGPNDSDFTNAAVWKIQLPAKVDMKANPLLRIRYVGDVARLTLNGKLIADNFYAGREFDLGLKRYGREILAGDLRLEILPLRKDAPIYIEPKDRPDFGKADSLVEVRSVQLINSPRD
jgi:beta-galactosidase